MKNNQYENAPNNIREAIEGASFIDDFLPPPELLVAREETKKITISLSKRSINFFKQVSDETHVPYQQMIRKVIDNYAEHYAK